MKRRMQWLGHLARMSNTRMPKQILFGRLKKVRPFHGVKMRWKGRVKKDMRSLKIYNHWFDRAQDRKGWHDLYHRSMGKLVEQRLEKEQEARRARQHPSSAVEALPFLCSQCQRRFRRQGDMTRNIIRSRERANSARNT